MGFWGTGHAVPFFSFRIYTGEAIMAVDIAMPQMGETIFKGTIPKWLKKPGDKVERDQPLFEISTDKVDAEIPSPSAGVLKEIKFGEGQTVPIQTVVGVIDAVGSPTAAAASAPAAVPAKSEAPPRPAASIASVPTPVLQPAAPAPAAAAAPAAQRFAPKLKRNSRNATRRS